MTEMMKKLQQLGIVPVVVLENAEDALPLAERLVKGGLPCAEVTFRTAAAEESIRRMAREFPEMIIGAGTVLTTEQADRAIDAGATFIVSPDVLKFFPAEPAGGLKMIKALAAPYVGVNFMPTGGISAANVRDYLAYDRIVACGGSWMVSGKLVKEGKFDEIEQLVREAAGIVKEIRG